MNKKRLAIIIGIVVAVVVVVVLLDTMLANHRPAITGLEAAQERVLPSGTCQIVCNATDSDGDELRYGWSADGGAISGEGATVTWTAPGSVGSYNVTVIVLDSHGTGITDYATVTVRRNNAPAIKSLVASSAWAMPSGSLNVTCDASDPDGDELSYEWTASGGNISGTGKAVTWFAPQEVGIYNVTVVVRDGHGREDTRFISLSVATGAPPTIEGMTVTAQEPKYLKPTSAGYKVGKTKVYYVECVASNTSGEVSYEWSCTGGDLSGEGPVITWTAPDPSGSVKVTVTVIVSDVTDNKVSESIVFDVVDCNTCNFG